MAVLGELASDQIKINVSQGQHFLEDGLVVCFRANGADVHVFLRCRLDRFNGFYVGSQRGRYRGTQSADDY